MNNTLLKRTFTLATAGAIVLGGVWLVQQAGSSDSVAIQLTPAANKPDQDQPLSFNRDIRPILSENCFACHGPDAAVAKDAGGFRLDIREGAVVPAKASGKVPIVPGDADTSEVIKRITTKKPNLVMPPPQAKISLTDDEVELLKRWINEGAEYEGHWAYETPTKPAPPTESETNAQW
ncbi:MAG: c-type cytochrome domain-containing protein, partial [Phycisphaeraceae bacterium]